MRILLDTRVWLWMQADPQRLSPAALQLVSDPGNDLFLSAASSWEMAIKYATGRLPLPEPPEKYVPRRMESSAVQPLAVTHTHALRVSGLPPHHCDPFDRLLVAQAQLEKLPILTVDRQLGAYDVEVRWADG